MNLYRDDAGGIIMTTIIVPGVVLKTKFLTPGKMILKTTLSMLIVKK